MINRRGLSFFAILSVVGVVGVFFVFTDTAPVYGIIGRIRLFYLLLCVFAVPVADWLLAGYRMWLFTSPVCPHISYWACVKNSAVGGFMGAATPSQTGGGVAQVYVLAKEGANGGQAISILFMTFLSTLVFYTIVSLGVLGLAATGRLPDIGVSTPFIAAALIFIALTMLGLFIVGYPDAFQRLVERAEIWARDRQRLHRWIAHLARHVDESSITVKTLIRRRTGRFMLSIPVTVLIFSNKYFAAYLASLALDLHPSLMELVTIQVFLNVMLYFFPTPGASGGAEMGTAILMQSVIPAPFLPAYTLLWRTSTTYLSVLVGGILLTLYIRGARVRMVSDSVSEEVVAG